MVPPETVATFKLLLVYENVPLLLDVGAVIVNAASPTTFVKSGKFVIVGALLLVKTGSVVA
jgi:hypothetical protein